MEDEVSEEEEEEVEISSPSKAKRQKVAIGRLKKGDEESEDDNDEEDEDKSIDSIDDLDPRSFKQYIKQLKNHNKQLVKEVETMKKKSEDQEKNSNETIDRYKKQLKSVSKLGPVNKAEEFSINRRCKEHFFHYIKFPNDIKIEQMLKKLSKDFNVDDMNLDNWVTIYSPVVRKAFNTKRNNVAQYIKTEIESK